MGSPRKHPKVESNSGSGAGAGVKLKIPIIFPTPSPTPSASSSSSSSAEPDPVDSEPKKPKLTSNGAVHLDVPVPEADTPEETIATDDSGLGKSSEESLEVGLDVDPEDSESEVTQEPLEPPEPAAEERARSESPIPENEYIVESIQDYADNLYFIKWLGWDESDNTWEPISCLENSPFLLYEFYKSRKAQLQGILVKSEYTFVNGRKRRRGPKINFEVPPDPRPIGIRAEEFFEKISKVPTEPEKDEWESLWRANFQRVEVQKKKDTGFRWARSKVEKLLEEFDMAGAIGADELDELRKQVYIWVLDWKRENAKEELKEWEDEMNTISGKLPLIQVENYVDWASRPEGFNYINDYLPSGPEVSIPDDPPQYCTCGTGSGDCSNNRKSCCEAHNLLDTQARGDKSYAYNSYKRLRPNITIGTPIFECNSRCSCDDKCTNRVVQDGRKSTKDLRLCIFRTDNNCGWGVKTLRPIKAGTFVSLYLGEIITSEEAERRGREYDEHGSTYLFDLDYASGDSNPYTVDAKKYGNITHFINHSCDPNLAVFNVWVNCLDTNLPNIALFAVKDIAKGEELSFDYLNGKEEETDNDSAEQPETRGPKFFSFPCMCNTAKCRKFLFR